MILGSETKRIFAASPALSYVARIVAMMLMTLVFCASCVGCQTQSVVTDGNVSSANATGNAEGLSTTDANENLGYEIVDADYVLTHRDSMKVVDVRTASEFNAGHIPGAINLEYSSSPCTAATVGEDQMALYQAAGITPSDAAILYCRTGVRAKAAAEILVGQGYENVKVYVGSWTDWTSDSSRPIES